MFPIVSSCLFLFGFIIHSELIAIQQSHCLGSSKSALREDEKLIEIESSSDKKNSSKILLVNKDAALPSEKVCISLRNTQLKKKKKQRNPQLRDFPGGPVVGT